jgi:flagellar secretion chaperone FliS
VKNQTGYANATTAYRAAATAASPLGKVVMLYDGVILRLRKTVSAVERKCPEEAFNHLNEATVILRGLCHCLDFDRGGKVAEQLQNTYIRLIMSALNAYGKRDAVVRFNKLIHAIGGMRGAWAEVRTRQALEERTNA